MKSIKIITPFALSIAVLAGCNNAEDVQSPPENAPAENQESQGTDQQQPTADRQLDYHFASFDLEVDSQQSMDTIDISYEKEQDGTEASYVDKEKNMKLAGDEAMKELDEKFKSFTFDQDTPDQEVLDEVSKAFDLPQDAKEIELEIEYADGTEKEYRNNASNQPEKQ